MTLRALQEGVPRPQEGTELKGKYCLVVVYDGDPHHTIDLVLGDTSVEAELLRLVIRV